MTVFRQESAGLSRALNLACSRARSGYLARLDADDAALPERLAHQVAFLDANADAAVVGGSGIMIDHRGLQFGIATYPETAAGVTRYLETGRVPLIHSAATMRADAFRAVSGYRPVIEPAEDYDLWLRIASRGHVTNLREPVVRYRIHADQVSTKDITRTATAVSVALAAARARSRGEPDPLDFAEYLDADLVAGLGISAAEIAAEEVDCGLWLARTLEKAGYHSRAEPLWSAVTESAAATASPRAARARVLRARADALGRSRHRVRALALRLRAAALEPRGAVKRLTSAVPRPGSRA